MSIKENIVGEEPATNYTSQIMPPEALVPTIAKTASQVTRSSNALPLGSALALGSEAAPAVMEAGRAAAGQVGAAVAANPTLGRFQAGYDMAQIGVKPAGKSLAAKAGGVVGNIRNFNYANAAEDAYYGFKGGRQALTAGSEASTVTKASNLAGRLFQNKPMGLVADAVGGLGTKIGNVASGGLNLGKGAVNLASSAAGGLSQAGGAITQYGGQAATFLAEKLPNIAQGLTAAKGGLGAAAGAVASKANPLMAVADLALGAYNGYNDKKRDAADRGGLERGVLGLLTGSASTGGSMTGKMMGLQEGGTADVTMGGLESMGKGAAIGATFGGVPGAAVGAVVGGGAELYKAESARQREGAAFDQQMKESNRGGLLAKVNEQGDVVSRTEGDKVAVSDFKNLSGMRLQLAQTARENNNEDLAQQLESSSVDLSTTEGRGSVAQLVDKAKMKYMEQKKANSGFFGSTDKYKEAEGQLQSLEGISKELTMAGDLSQGRKTMMGLEQQQLPMAAAEQQTQRLTSVDQSFDEQAKYFGLPSLEEDKATFANALKSKGTSFDKNAEYFGKPSLAADEAAFANTLKSKGTITRGDKSFAEIETANKNREDKKLTARSEAAAKKEADDLAARKGMGYEDKLAETARTDPDNLNVRERLHLREAQGAQEELTQAQAGGDAEKIAKAQAKIQSIEESRKAVNLKETGKAEGSKDLEARLAMVRSGALPQVEAATEYTAQQATQPQVGQQPLTSAAQLAGMSRSGFGGGSAAPIGTAPPTMFSSGVLDQAKTEYDQIEAEKARQKAAAEQAAQQTMSYDSMSQQMKGNLFGELPGGQFQAAPPQGTTPISSPGVISNMAKPNAAGTPALGNLAGIDPAAISEALSGTFNNFITALQNIQLPKIPETITMEGRHTVEVIINGAEALKSIDQGIRDMVTDKINEAMKNINNKTEGGFGP
jgi:hypothetical protein